jgi:hypothetical protein
MSIYNLGYFDLSRFRCKLYELIINDFRFITRIK